MRYALCHFSFHRTWKAEGWDCRRLCAETRELGFTAIDFHARLLGDLDRAREDIPEALAEYELTLSGLSLGNNYAAEDDDQFEQQVATVVDGLELAAAVGAPVSRIFGGHLPKEQREDPATYARYDARIKQGLERVLPVAERLGVVLALENHGGLPAKASEQLAVIEHFDSPWLRATIDVGNYMQVGEQGHEALAAVVDKAAYIHFKDFAWGEPLVPHTLGDGDVDLGACLRTLAQAGYEGFIAIEYEGSEDERTGIRRSMDHLATLEGRPPGRP